MTNEVNVAAKTGLTSDEGTRPGRTIVPDVDIWEADDALWLRADLPGVDENSIDVSLDDGKLSIEGRVAVEDYENLSPVYTEYTVGNYARSFHLSDAIDADKIRAKLADGVLELELPKAERLRRREIPIQT